MTREFIAVDAVVDGRRYTATVLLVGTLQVRVTSAPDGDREAVEVSGPLRLEASGVVVEYTGLPERLLEPLEYALDERIARVVARARAEEDE